MPVERELVFDIDLTDYDDVRTCGKEGHICGACWPLMAVAVEVQGLPFDTLESNTACYSLMESCTTHVCSSCMATRLDDNSGIVHCADH